MKVLIISRGYPTEKFKTNGIFEFDQAKALVSNGIDVIYAAIDVRSIRRWRKWGYESFLKDGVCIEAINFPCGRIPNCFLDKVREILISKLYRRIVDKYGKPDIIHSHFIGMGYVTAKVLKKTNIPLIHTEHASGMNQKTLSKYYRNLGDNTYKYMDVVIAVSNSLANSLSENFNIGSIVIPNIVDASIFKYKPINSNNNIYNFISVGNLIKSKKMDLLIFSFNKAFNRNKKAKLYIFGDGSERKKLQALIDELKLTNQVFLMGQVDRRVIAEKMHESHCFVLASDSETFGVAYIEAMAAGLPVIATKCGGPEDFVDDSNGILINIGSQQELVKALEDMYNNINFYNKDIISKETIRKFSSQYISKLIINEYQKVYKEKM